MNDYDAQYANYAQIVEEALVRCFECKFDSPDNIVSAMKYSLFAGGKRLRPILMLATCDMLGGDLEDAVRPACALEMIHTYSLIHDDLPAMDNDDLRRGKPTNHIVYGEDIAILAGDALLNYAMETMLSKMPESPEKMAVLFAVMKKLFYAAGVNGMIGGQTGDLLCEGDVEVNEAKLAYVYAHKTGALIEAAIIGGAMIGGASEAEIDALSRYSAAIGTAFQIVDDILDIRGDEKTLGKPIGSDEKNSKATFVSMYGLASASEKLEDLRQTALNALDELDCDTQFLRDTVVFICDRVY